MKIHLESPEVLNLRIENLFNTLNSFNRVSVSIDFCRNLGAQSLGWRDWSHLCAGHSTPEYLPEHTTLVSYTGRWINTELNKESASNKLYELITKHLSYKLGFHAERSAIANSFWPTETSVFEEIIGNQSKGNIPFVDIPNHYFRDNVFVSYDCDKIQMDFNEKVILPTLSKNNGILICDELDAYKAINHLSSNQKEHIVIRCNENNEIKDELLITSHSELRDLVFDFDECELARPTLVEVLKADSDLGDFNSKSICSINNIISKLPKGQCQRKNISLSQVINAEKPVVIISSSESLLCKTILTGLMIHFKRAMEEIKFGKKTVNLKKAPKLLILEKCADVHIDGFGENSEFASSADWTIVTTQKNSSIDESTCELTEVPSIISNSSNIFNLKTTIGKNNWQPNLADWYNVRNKTVSAGVLINDAFNSTNETTLISDSVPPITVSW